MYSSRSGKNHVYLILIAALAVFSMACGLLNQALEAITSSGLEALRESEAIDQVFTVIEMVEGESVDLTDYEIPGSEFLFEVDPFDDVIRWRFYAVFADLEDIGTFYSERLPDFMVETDQEINGYRYLVFTAGHPLSSIYSRDQLQALEAGYQAMRSAFLDVEVLNSSAHQDSGRLAIAETMGLTPRPVPEDTTLVILVYNQPSVGLDGILDLAPGIIPGLEEGDFPIDLGDPTDENDAERDDQSKQDDDRFADFTDDEDREVEDLAGLCNQVLGSGACYHPYLPVVEGFSRSYQSEDGITTETVTEVWADGFTVVTETADGHTVSADFDCTPDGVAGWNFDDAIMGTLEGVPSDLSIDIDIDGVQLPTEFAVGDTWSALVTTTISMQAAGAESKNVIQIEMDYTAAGEETITTPAGRFRAMRIDYVSSGENTLVMSGSGGSFSQIIFTVEGYGSEWYVECLGKVGSVAYSNWTGITSVESETRMELSNFGLQ